MRRIIEHTADGSATLYVPELNEHYHSVKGARTESQHIFVDLGLKYTQATQPHVLEIGFGTGLNAYLSLLAANETGRKVHYTGLELYPLKWDTIAELKYSDDPLFKRIHTTDWEVETDIGPNFTLLKQQMDFTKIHLAPTRMETWVPRLGARMETSQRHVAADVVYFDAFAPEKQPEMWEQQLFDHLYAIMNKNGVLTTYCAKGVVRRMLQRAGFTVERLPGPPGGKREILRAIKTATCRQERIKNSGSLYDRENNITKR